jgi:hypothetical protein
MLELEHRTGNNEMTVRILELLLFEHE